MSRKTQQTLSHMWFPTLFVRKGDIGEPDVRRVQCHKTVPDKVKLLIKDEKDRINYDPTQDDDLYEQVLACIQVNLITPMIEDGTFDKVAAQCAKQLHKGNLWRAYQEWDINLSSNRTNFAAADGGANQSEKNDKWACYYLIRRYVRARKFELKTDKPYHAWTIAEAKATTTERELRSVRDGMASHKSKDGVEDPEFLERYRAVCKIYSERHGKKTTRLAAALDDDLISKIQAGKTSLKKSEVEQLRELLKQIGK